VSPEWSHYRSRERLDGELNAFGAVLAMASIGLPVVIQLIARADGKATLLSLAA
jgi:hypothetical protein